MKDIEVLRNRLQESSYAHSKYDEAAAWYEYAREVVAEFEKRGYSALCASLCFTGWGLV